MTRKLTLAPFCIDETHYSLLECFKGLNESQMTGIDR